MSPSLMPNDTVLWRRAGTRQQALLADPAALSHHVTALWRWDGDVDATLLAAAVDRVVAGSAALRSRFRSDDSGYLVAVGPPDPDCVDVVDLRDEPTADTSAEALVACHATLPFDLAHQGPVRALVLRVAADRTLLHVTSHRLGMAEDSIPVFGRRVFTAYRHLVSGDESAVPDPDTLLDVVPDEPVDERDVRFWRETLADGPVGPAFAGRRRDTGARPGATISCRIPTSTTERARARARRLGVTLDCLLLSVLEVLVARSTSDTDFVIAIPSTARPADSLGCFATMLPIRATVARDGRFDELVRQTWTRQVQAMAHASAPIGDGAPPLRLAFAHRDARACTEDRLDGVRVTLSFTATGTARFEQTWTAVEHADHVEFEVEYNSDAYDAAEIDLLTEHFVALLENLLDDEHVPIGDVPLMSDAESARVRELAGGTRRFPTWSASTGWWSGRPRCVRTRSPWCATACPSTMDS